jgi:hypothetical protein
VEEEVPGMTDLMIDRDESVLRLSTAEHVEGVHGNLPVPIAAVRGIEVLDDAHRPAEPHSGLEIDTGIPGVIEVGTVQGLHRR